MQVCLASASPRRLELLRGVGIEPLVLVSGADETLLPGESPEAHVVRLARDKGEAVRSRLPAGAALLIAADTVVVLDGEILGKPGTEERAAAMLGRLSGREHRVLTGLASLPPPPECGVSPAVKPGFSSGRLTPPGSRSMFPQIV